MFTNLKLGTKLGLAFGAVAVVTLLLGAVGYVSVARSSATVTDIATNNLPSISSLVNIETGADGVRSVLRSLMIPGLPATMRAAQYEEVAAIRKKYEEHWKRYEGLEHTPQAEEAWKTVGGLWQKWREANNAFFKLAHELDELNIPDPFRLTMQLNRFIADHYALETKVLRAIYEGKEFEGGADATACNFGKWLKGFSHDNLELAAAITTAAEAHTHLHASVAALKEQLAAHDEAGARAEYAERFIPNLGIIHTQFGVVDKLAERGRTAFDAAMTQGLGPCEEAMGKARTALHEAVRVSEEHAAEDSQVAFAQAGRLQRITLAAMSAGAIGALVLGLLITRSVTRPIHQIVGRLSRGASLVADASQQVNQSAGQLATASTEQATALQETTAALENMASMAVENASGAKEANTLVTQARSEAEQSDQEMTRLNAAMSAINESSQQISRIIKVIEEIAFQTNLLALNAAVEAARAGEHGKGFAVVADEVRNLAQRAAQAARETTTLIEASVGRAKEGTDVSRSFGTTLAGIVGNVTRASTLVGQIDAASHAQSEGVHQIRAAITQMDEVTQSIAASAEQSAASVQELSAQATAVSETADQLGAMVGTPAVEKAHAAERA